MAVRYTLKIAQFKMVNLEPFSHQLLIQISFIVFRPANGLEGLYRFILAGKDHVTVKVMVTLVFALPQLEGLELFGQFVPGHQVPIQNLNAIDL
jgi:hypothetical protein